MMRLILVLALFLSSLVASPAAVAAPSVASAQRDVDRLRTLAAEKYEAANEANIRIKQLEKESSALVAKEALLKEHLAKVQSQEAYALSAVRVYKSLGVF